MENSKLFGDSTPFFLSGWKRTFKFVIIPKKSILKKNLKKKKMAKELESFKIESQKCLRPKVLNREFNKISSIK